MRQNFKVQLLTIPNKLRVEMRCSFDEKSEYTGIQDLTVIRPMTSVLINLIKPYNPNEPRVWNPNDSLMLTSYGLPIFLENLKKIQREMETPDLYKYTDNRLELNNEIAERIRKVFMIMNTTIELSAVIIETNDLRVEGIKIKFNNENSAIGLTLNEIEVLRFTLCKVDFGNFATNLYFNYYKRNNSEGGSGTIDPVMVDIAPLTSS